MAEAHLGWSIAELAAFVGGRARGESTVRFFRPVPAGTGGSSDVTFAETPGHLALALSSSVGIVIVGEDAPEFDRPAILVPVPREAFFRLLADVERPVPAQPGIDPAARVSSTANVDPTASVAAFAVVEDGARLGPGVVVMAGSYVGSDCVVGTDSILFPRVVLVSEVTIGMRCRLQSGAVIGSDGFGFVWDGSRHVKVPQVGGVRIGDDVEIGANSCVDRATCGETTIGDGTKIDNHVHIGHNGKIGRHVILTGHVVLAGSVTLGDRVVVGGQAAVGQHVSVSEDVVLAGRTGVTKDITTKGEYFGLPAQPAGQAMRQLAMLGRIGALFERVSRLERDRDE